MSIITITATGIGPEIVSGIPQFVVLTTNIPSTIFYTLDGSEPSVFSNVYLSTLEMPGDISTRLRVLAISGPDSGTLDITFNMEAFPEYLISSRDGSGIVVDAYDVVNVVLDGYTTDDNNILSIPTKGSDYELKDLDIKYSKTDHLGNPPGTMIRIGYPDPREINEEKHTGISFIASSPNNRNAFFNPKSLYITIDGRDGYDDQAYDGYKLITRPWSGTMDLSKYNGGSLLYEQNPYISGGFVRSFFNKEKGIRVSYYFDHNETRWIKSIQNWTPPITTIGSNPISNFPLVFKWIYNRRSMI